MANRKPSRRQFVAAGLTTPLLATPLTAETADEKPKKPVSKTVAMSEALLEVVKLQHGDHIDKEDFPKIQQSIQRGLATGERLRRVKLTNGDEPAFVFTPDLP